MLPAGPAPLSTAVVPPYQRKGSRRRVESLNREIEGPVVKAGRQIWKTKYLDPSARSIRRGPPQQTYWKGVSEGEIVTRLD